MQAQNLPRPAPAGKSVSGQGVRPRECAKGGRVVSRVLFVYRGRRMVIYLGRPSPDASSSLPTARAVRAHLAAYLALLRLGVTLPPLLPAARWALTPPFHPYPPRWAVCFLWPCPSPCGAQALPGNRPCGARTFLEARRPRDHRTRPLRAGKDNVPGRDRKPRAGRQPVSDDSRARLCSARLRRASKGSVADCHWATTSRYSRWASSTRPSSS